MSRVISASPEAVYAFASNVENLPRWAAGLARAAVVTCGEPNSGTLVVDSPMGLVTVQFTPRNDLGVLDHDVTLPTGGTVNNPLRVVSHPLGSEVIFTVRQLDLSGEEFIRDVRTVGDDLDRLRRLLETEAEAAATETEDEAATHEPGT